MQGRVVPAWHHACRAIPDSLGHDGESLYKALHRNGLQHILLPTCLSSHRELM